MFNAFSKFLPYRLTQLAVAAYFKANTLATVGWNKTHSNPKVFPLEKMKIRILPALSDNYMYLIIDENTKQAAVVDPVAPDSVLQAVLEEGCNLTKILTTHHHWDHAGGNEELIKKSRNALQVFGGSSRVGGLTNEVKHGDKFTIGDINVECLRTPCHTQDHVCYYLTAAEQTPAVFTGDTLFIAGCGRFFEGTAEQMYSSLIERLGGLPDNTHVFCGHEYTQQNLKFAKHVEKDNPDILKRIEWAKNKRDSGEPTVPSTIADEKQTNPFMRVNEKAVQKHAKCNDGISTMLSIRKEKDSFKDLDGTKVTWMPCAL